MAAISIANAISNRLMTFVVIPSCRVSSLFSMSTTQTWFSIVNIQICFHLLSKVESNPNIFLQDPPCVSLFPLRLLVEMDVRPSSSQFPGDIWRTPERFKKKLFELLFFGRNCGGQWHLWIIIDEEYGVRWGEPVANQRPVLTAKTTELRSEEVGFFPSELAQPGGLSEKWKPLLSNHHVSYWNHHVGIFIIILPLQTSPLLERAVVWCSPSHGQSLIVHKQLIFCWFWWFSIYNKNN